MDRYPVGKHTMPTRDAIPGWARMVLYGLALLAPFVALLFGRLEGDQAVAAVVTIFGLLGPAVAVAYNVKQTGDEKAMFRAGYAEAFGEHVAGGGSVTENADDRGPPAKVRPTTELPRHELPDDDDTRGRR